MLVIAGLYHRSSNEPRVLLRPCWDPRDWLWELCYWFEDRPWLMLPSYLQSPTVCCKNSEINNDDNDQHSNFQSLPLTLFTFFFFKSWWRTGAGSRHVYAGGSRAVRCIELESLGNRVWLEDLITQPSLDWARQRKSMNVYFPAAQITVFLLQMVRDPGANAGKVKDQTAPVEDWLK